jgi:hypothetical protein
MSCTSPPPAGLLWSAWTGSAGSYVPSALADAALGDRVEFSIMPGGEGRDMHVLD